MGRGCASWVSGLGLRLGYCGGRRGKRSEGRGVPERRAMVLFGLISRFGDGFAGCWCRRYIGLVGLGLADANLGSFLGQVDVGGG